MLNLKENWPQMALIAVVSVICALAVDRYVLAAWQDPTEEPGSAAVGGIVTTPLYEDLDLGGYNIVDSKMDESLTKIGKIESTNYCCRMDSAAFYGVADNGTGYAFYGSTTVPNSPVAYFKGNVGIGIASAPTHLLELASVAGTNNAELTLKSGANGYWGVYNDETTDQLRFWNNTVPGDKHALILGSDGNVQILNGFLQIDTQIAAPTNNPTCLNASHIGRMILVSGTSRLYICSGAALGGQSWRYVNLTP